VPTDTRRSTAVKGEEEAARFLTRSGYSILDKNVRTRAGEIDLVAKEGKVLVFVEVKTRRDTPPVEPEKPEKGERGEKGDKVDKGDPPQAAVHTRKQNRLAKLAHGYLKLKRIRQTPCRFDVVSVIINDEGGVKAIRHIPNAFSVAPW
jgi:putative endonuclease